MIDKQLGMPKLLFNLGISTNLAGCNGEKSGSFITIQPQICNLSYTVLSDGGRFVRSPRCINCCRQIKRNPANILILKLLVFQTKVEILVRVDCIWYAITIPSRLGLYFRFNLCSPIDS